MIVRKSQEGISEKRRSDAAEKVIFLSWNDPSQTKVSIRVTMLHFLPTIVFETNPKLDFDHRPDILFHREGMESA